MKINVLSRLTYGSLLAGGACLVFFFLPLNPPTVKDVPAEHIFFRGSPQDLQVSALVKVGGVNSESFLAPAYKPIPKADLRALGQDFTLVFKRDGFESLKRSFSGMKTTALLSGDSYPEDVPVSLEGGGSVIALKMRWSHRWGWLVAALGSFGFFGFFFFKQDSANTLADALVKLKAEAGNDNFIGTTVKDYRITKHLGKGAWGSVYEAVPDNFFGTPKAEKYRVAIKFYALTGTDDHPSFRARFVKEGFALKDLDHPNIVRFIEGGETEDELPENRKPYIVLSYVPGRPMDEIVCEKRIIKFIQGGEEEEREERDYFTFMPDKAVEMLSPIVEALQYAHDKNVIHRDLKPGNVKIDADGKTVLLDFGLSKLSQSDLTQTGTTMGTPLYAPPEMILNARTADHRADQFSLGVMMFHMLTGFHPFGEERNEIWSSLVNLKSKPRPFPESREHLSQELENVLSKMMAIDREDRFDSITEAFDAFKKASKA